MSGPVVPPPSWFLTVTRPVSRLVWTILALALFVAGFILSAVFPDFRFLLQGTAVIVVMAWYFVMAKHHKTAKRQD